jgi:hypothetical protein
MASQDSLTRKIRKSEYLTDAELIELKLDGLDELKAQFDAEFDSVVKWIKEVVQTKGKGRGQSEGMEPANYNEDEDKGGW